MTNAPLATADRRVGRAELIRLLLLMTAGFTLLAMFGEIVLMASPWYAVLPIGKAILLLVLARKVAAQRRWALMATIVVSALGLTGFVASSLVGLIPQLDHTLTLTGLITQIALPITLILLCAQLLTTQQQHHPVPEAAR
ncbi:hypothetical protein Rhe02_05870 [Rhizocola hellebori]|uniref:Uncharacterized protein n=1 Tax=Rhizocola hellebori TaxID=1392758 RepID=A0A8J3Q2D2_9ACTN|nr:hypothetical protein [Rhizocola hellebori]GIH02520.1 hypothetical protein Rhe02_05870 [Rhizocola hellebori]